MTTTEAIKLLAIDDKPDNLTTLGAAVRDTLLQTIVLTATDGLTGFALAAEDPDVILLGIDMPGMDSFEVCRRLKADERLSEIPVVFVTDRNTDVASRVKALEAGAEGFLTHPLEPAELTAQIRAMVKVKAANRRQRLEKEQLEALVAERTQALHEGDERFRVAQEMSPDGFTILHPLRNAKGEIVDFTWVYENQTIARINGTDPEEVKGKRLLDLFPTHAGTAVWEAYIRAADTGQPQTIEEIYVGEIVSRPTWLLLIVVSIGEDIAILTHDITDRKQAEEERRKSEERLKAAERMAHLGRWELDLVTNVLTWSDEIYRIFEIDPAQFGASYEAFLNAIHPDDRDAVSQAYSSSLETRTDYAIDHRLLMPDGRVKYVHEHCITLYDANGRAVRSVGTVQDITARKQAEEALQESLAMLAQTEGIAHVGSWEWDVATDTVVWSDELFRIFQLDPGRGAPSFAEQPELFLPEDMQRLRQAGETAVVSGAPYELEMRAIRTDGEIRHCLARGRAEMGPEGKATRLFGSFQDITARKQMEQERERLSAEVRAQARQMAQILATVPAGVLLLDAAGQVLRANTVAAGDLAVLAGVAVGDTLTRLGERPLAELLTSPPTRGVWHEVKTAGRTFEVIARPVENDPEPALWVLVIIDVTREREIQAQLQQQAQLAVVGQLAAGIAHDFNNIMAVIVLYAELGMSMADVPPQLRERLGVILQQANRATDLIQQILDFSRRAVLERRPLDLVNFLKETVKLLERTLPESIGIELAYAKDAYTVSADPTRMQQAIMNLATNARDAMLPQGGGELRISLSRMAATDETRCITCGQVFAGDQWVRIVVTDSGSGIPPDALPHIFEPFFTTKEVGKGTGLGLAQVYGIVKQHEGHIDVVTEVGRGTTFNLYLPALSVRPPQAPAYEREAAVQGQGETVLLVEDNAVLREALAVLEQRADEIALVLTDLVMPEMGGQALLHAMRQRGLTLPVVILSGHPMESELEALQALSLAGWMLKPPSVKPLAQLLTQALHRESEPG